MQFKELSDFQEKLLIELSSGRGLQGLVAKISAYSRKPIIVLNSSTRVLASSFAIQPKKEFIEILEYNQKKNRISITLNDQKLEGLVFLVESNNLKLGSLLILDACLSDDFIMQLGKAAALSCAAEIVKQNELLLFERQYKEAFIYELLYGNIENNQDIISQGEIWGWNLEYPHGVIVFELEEYEQYSSDFQLVKILFDIVSTKLGKIGKKPILLNKKGEIVVLLTIDKCSFQEQKTLIEMFVKKVINKAEEKVAPRIVRVGVGRIYDNPNEIFRSYQEAKVALELGRLLNMRLTIPCFGDLGLARILYNHDYQELQDFYQETLGNLEKYDKEQGSELLNSLEKYLLHRCELKTAADALFLHPNTLRYRLKKIEEILSLDLNEFDIKLNLMAAFKIKYLKKV
jgi:sugar diacid utilization regulator